MFNIFSSLFDWIFPLSCIQCGASDQLVCSNCVSNLKHDGREVSLLPLTRIHIAGDYQQVLLQKLIKHFKYHNMPQLRSPLGTYLLQSMPVEWRSEQFELIPVPLHSGRYRQRGYNQSKLLAEHIAMETGQIINDNLHRKRSTRAQARLTREQRLKNVQDAFSYSGESIANKNIILIDDVMTTGSTLQAAAESLLPHQPQSIVGLILARNQSLDH